MKFKGGVSLCLNGGFVAIKKITKMGKMPLSKLCVGQKALVLHLENDNPALRRRLIDMGITEGVEVCIKSCLTWRSG